jgi:hypothetical protein
MTLARSSVRAYGVTAFWLKYHPVPSTRDRDCPVPAPDAPDAAVRIFDSVGAGSGNTTSPYCRAVRCYSFENRQSLPFIEFIMTRKFHPLFRTQSSTNFILFCPACPLAHLHIIIHGFVFEEVTKPAHEHHLQVS